MRKFIEIYDTTLRDGSQSADVSFSLQDKLNITRILVDLGVHYIEGGWPGSNPKDEEYFNEVKKIDTKETKIVAFGSTRKPRISVEDDKNIKSLLDAETEIITIVGKTWDFHVREALGTTLDENLRMIHDTVYYLKSKGRKVIFDAEHYFDGFKRARDYALKCLKVAESAGADIIVLCDTNGGSFPWEVEEIVGETVSQVKTPLGIHAHNDSDTAVSNTLSAVRAGVTHVQGTMNGLGERCGNADLCSIIPALQLKMGYRCIDSSKLKKLRETSIFIYEIANIPPRKHQPYVGDNAFAHKGGFHASGIKRNSSTYEHINPSLVGNRRKIVISELAGKSNIYLKMKEMGIKLKEGSPILEKLVTRIKELEAKGFQFEGADASLELFIRKLRRKKKRFFKFKGFRVIEEKTKLDEPPVSEATIMIEVDGNVEHTAALGNGPVNALDNALRKAIEKFYPELKKVKLEDFKVRVIPEGKGTASVVRVLIESGDGKETWTTVGVSENIIEASWQALVDSIEYKLMKMEKEGKRMNKNE